MNKFKKIITWWSIVIFLSVVTFGDWLAKKESIKRAKCKIHRGSD